MQRMAVFTILSSIYYKKSKQPTECLLKKLEDLPSYRRFKLLGMTSI
jgi:hypothetical protein